MTELTIESVFGYLLNIVLQNRLIENRLGHMMAIEILDVLKNNTILSKYVFGTKAGIVWEALNKNGPSNINDIVKTTSMRRELVYGALCWLDRENKITVERQGRAMVFSLRQ